MEGQLGENAEVIGNLVRGANIKLHGHLKSAVFVSDVHVVEVTVFGAAKAVHVLGFVGEVEVDGDARVGENTYCIGDVEGHFEFQRHLKISTRKLPFDGDVGGLNEVGQLTQVGELVLHAQDVEVQPRREGEVVGEVRVDEQTCAKSHLGAEVFAGLFGRRVCPSPVGAYLKANVDSSYLNNLRS